MTKKNPSNPFTNDPSHTQKDVQMAVSKAKVVSAKGHPEKNGFHTVRIQAYTDDATYVAPVLTPTPGSVWVPPEGSDVAVIFDQADKPWVIGSWYAIDRAAEEGDVDLPAYEPGDLRLGNTTGAHVTVDASGNVHIQSSDNGSVFIDGVEQ